MVGAADEPVKPLLQSSLEKAAQFCEPPRPLSGCVLSKNRSTVDAIAYQHIRCARE